MQLFRRLAGNIFFKIILAFVALSFIFFGVSGFILGNGNSWVAKVGNYTIGYNGFSKAMQSDREAILASSKSEEALKYLESEQFKSDVLGRMVNRVMIEKLHDDFGVEASRKLILSTVAKDPSFKKDGKFDRETFKKFLAKHGLNEEKYVSEIANDITATMIIQTIAMASPLNGNMLLEVENFKHEKRLADVITISLKDVKNPEKISEEEIEKFFAENKQKYAVPELRTVSYLHFSKQNFAKDLQVPESEILAEYEKNKEQFSKPESRNFYHILFDKEASAQEFLQKLDEATKSDKSKIAAEFAKLAFELQKKDLKAITFAQVTKKDLIPELSEPTFKLALNEHSSALASPLGFHVFLLNEIKQSQPIPFAEVKNSIKQKLLEGREDKVLQSKISEIDDALLTLNSLPSVAAKFGLKITSPAVKISQNGQNEKGEAVNEIKGFANFAENAFALKKGQVSKIFYAQNSEGFYALQLEEIEVAHERQLAEIKSQVAADLAMSKKRAALQNLAKKIGEEIAAEPAEALKIAAKYKLKLEKDREFPRVFYVNFQGRQVPYQSKFLDELFALKPGQPTSVLAGGEQEFVIGILRQIKESAIDSSQFEQAKKEAEESFRTEILQEYNGFLLKKNPVEVNEKIFGAKTDQEAK